MNAVDTNIIVRLLMRDQIEQTAAARVLLSEEPMWIAKTVLLETEWVLRSNYGLDSAAVRERLSALLGLDGVIVEDEAAVGCAMKLAAEGIDLADALHLTSTPPGVTFVTFDRKLAQRAARAGATDYGSRCLCPDHSRRRVQDG
jgi:predicted nucleic-acid-binding protein